MTAARSEIAPGDRRSAARVAAVQALYQVEVGGGAIEAVIDEFIEHRLGVAIDGAPAVETNVELFAELVRGATERRDELDALISGALVEGWRMERLELVLRAVLRAGTVELLARPAAPARVVIDEYVDVAHAFFANSVPGFVNGVLDRLARDLRPAEFDAPDGPE